MVNIIFIKLKYRVQMPGIIVLVFRSTSEKKIINFYFSHMCDWFNVCFVFIFFFFFYYSLSIFYLFFSQLKYRKCDRFNDKIK